MWAKHELLASSSKTQVCCPPICIYVENGEREWTIGDGALLLSLPLSLD